jgi:FixJ family two-component response regulator
MPGLSGYDLAIRLAELRPNIKCLFISGFAADFIPHVRILDTDMNFLAKPFQRDVLARKVREVLGGPEKGRTGAM